jgi:hypothetical protein
VPCSPIKVNQRFGRTYHTHLQCQRINQAGSKKSFACYLLHAGFLFGLFFDPENGGDVPPKSHLTFTGLRGIMSQKIELFIRIRLISMYEYIQKSRLRITYTYHVNRSFILKCL